MVKFLFVLGFSLMQWKENFAQVPKPYNNYSVTFGKHLKKIHGETNVVRIFLDKDGNYYPDVYISDGALRKCHSSLTEWYADHKDEFAELCNANHVTTGSFEEKLMRLNGALALRIADSINAKAQNCDLVDVSIHGFSKKAYGGRVIDRLSPGDNKRLESALTRNAKAKIFFVEVYWDGKYIGVVHGSIMGKWYYIFRDAGIPNATNAGLALRKVISNITNQRINIITHSLGARVACELLFNVEDSNTARQQSTPTPQQSHIKLCMIAPAISSGLFRNYWQRGANVARPESDHYSVSVVYNTNDVVLNKTMRVLFFRIGNHTADDIASTALGCDYKNDLSKLKDNLNGRLRTFNQSTRHGRPSTGHYLNHGYINNKAPFAAVVEYLNKEDL